MIKRLTAILTIVALTAAPGAALAQTLVADLSDHHVALSSSFTGTEIIVFGTIEGDLFTENLSPYDVVVVIEGPDIDVTVRQKQKIAGIWVNLNSGIIEDIPSFYYVASNVPMNEIAPTLMRQTNGIGVDVLGLREGDHPLEETPLYEIFREAYVDLSTETGMVVQDTSGVRFRGDRLFRARVPIPSSVQEGAYSVSVYLFQGQSILGAQNLTLTIDKVGIEGRLNTMAHEQPYLYGILALLMALSLGWGTSLVFRPR